MKIIKLILILIFSVLFVAFFVWFSNWQTKKALKTFDANCLGRFDTSFECIENGVCDCTTGKTNN